MELIIISLSGLIIFLSYELKNEKEKHKTLNYELWDRKEKIKTLKVEHKFELEKAKEDWKQLTSAWILEKESQVEELEKEKFDQLHELALMLNESYEFEEVIFKKAEIHDFLLHDANRRQRREFIEKGQFTL